MMISDLSEFRARPLMEGVMPRPGIASSTLGQLHRMRLNNNLPLAKIPITTTPVLLCGCEPRTIVKEDYKARSISYEMSTSHPRHQMVRLHNLRLRLQ